MIEPQPITGAVGLSTWATAATYDDVAVTRRTAACCSPTTSPTAPGSGPRGRPGTWSVVDGEYVQTDTAAQDTLVKAGQHHRDRLRPDAQGHQDTPAPRASWSRSG